MNSIELEVWAQISNKSMNNNGLETFYIETNIYFINSNGFGKKKL